MKQLDDRVHPRKEPEVSLSDEYQRGFRDGRRAALMDVLAAVDGAIEGLAHENEEALG